MIKLFKSYIAHKNWIKAHSLLANQSPDMAFIAIKKALDVEPDDEKKLKYLELKKNIESALKSGNGSYIKL